MKNQAVAPAVDTDQLTVEHWRERFKEALPRFKSLREVAELLAREDAQFDGITGWDRLNNIKRGKGGLKITAKAVQLMDQLRPASQSRIRRQQLRRDS